MQDTTSPRRWRRLRFHATRRRCRFQVRLAGGVTFDPNHVEFRVAVQNQNAGGGNDYIRYYTNLARVRLPRMGMIGWGCKGRIPTAFM